MSANLAPLAVGTETDGSIVCPATNNGIVGIKPTVGLVSRAGVIPISHTQDTAGPMARTVSDAAALLTALAGSDAGDPATKGAEQHATDYTKALDPNGLKGARIGIPRAFFYDRVTPPGETAPRGGLTPEQARVMAEAIEVLAVEAAG